jgi:TRAP-type transport system periplasmic protein
MKLKALAVAMGCVLSLGLTQAQVQERTIRFGHVVQPGAPVPMGVQKFAELVASRSGGKIKIQEFGGGTLGGEAQQLSAVQGGIQDMTQLSATILGGVVREFTLLDIPFSFTKAEQVDALLAGPFGQALAAKLPDKGLIGLGFWETGFRNFSNSRRPIAQLDDIKGLKIRVIPNPMFLKSFESIGASPVPMAFPELYGALESRAVDAQENPSAVILSSRFHEVQKYLSISNHVYTANPVLISKKLWDRLSPEEQKIIRDSALEAGVYQRKVSRESEQSARKELATKGMQINEVPAATLAKMRELSQASIEPLIKTYDQALVGLYTGEIQRVRAAVK